VSRATDELEKAKEALASAENAAAEVDAKLEAVFGVPADFPDDLDPAFRPEGMEDRVKAAMKGSGLGEVAHVDCEEYPCIAVVTLPGFDTNSMFEGKYDSVTEAFAGSFPNRDARDYFGSGGTGEHRIAYGIVSLGPDGDAEETDRLWYRLELAAAYFDAELEEEAL
jgi:hypothetical protein